MDAKTAFLNGELENGIFIEQPEGFADKEKPEMVCKLQKSLYRLKQSARCWNKSINNFLLNSDYIKSNALYIPR